MYFYQLICKWSWWIPIYIVAWKNVDTPPTDAIFRLCGTGLVVWNDMKIVIIEVALKNNVLSIDLYNICGSANVLCCFF